MDTLDNDNRSSGSIWGEMGVIEWLSLLLPVTFIVFGAGMITGIFFSGSNASTGPSIRLPAGVGLCLWGIFRIAMVFVRLNRQKTGKQHG